MRLFFIIISLVIFLILSINPYLIIAYWSVLESFDVARKLLFILIFVCIESIIIISLIKWFFHSPILKLEYNIKNFLVWWLKDKDIKLWKSLNPHVDFIIAFFSKTLDTLKNIKSEFLHWKAIKSEVELWKEIQYKILSKKLTIPPSLSISVKSKPAWEIGWDSYDIIKQENNYYIYVWDATWHWVWAWFIMMMVNALISWFSKIFKSWDQILAKTNEILKPRVKANLLMTLLLIRWDEENKKVYMTWSWHEYLMIYKQNTWKCYKIKSSWVALWMIKDISKIVKEKEISFELNDIIVLYTDWITEAINKPKKDWSEEMFWEDRLINAIENAPNDIWKNYKTSKSVFDNITIELSKFMWYKHSQLDDITLCVIHYRWKDYSISDSNYEELSDEFITEWNWN